VAALGSFSGLLTISLTTVAALLSLPAPAAEWAVVADASRVAMSVDKQGTWFGGSFKTFTAAIDFDPAAPAAGSIVGTVQTPSFETEDSQNHTYVVGYLEVEAHPEARFVSQSIEPAADGYRAVGELTLKGTTHPVALDFTFTHPDASGVAGPKAWLQGRMTVNRFDFDIASDVDTSWAGRDVIVLVELELSR
jgi:polyisoprenoid-binding protein YceI